MTICELDAIPGAQCRVSGAPDLLPVLSMGDTALADVLLREADLDDDEPVYPLELAFSPTSALLQLVHTVSPELSYDEDYPYFSSAVPELVTHFTASARRIVEKRALGGDSLVVEAASNDGYMLRVFAEHGIRVLGVDPAPGPVRAARDAGVESIEDFFTAAVARELRAKGYAADVVLGNNVLNLVPDPNDFAIAVRELLKDDGAAVLEVPYAVEMIDRCAYDSIFHQNVSYFTLTSIERLFRSHDLAVVDVERVPTFGGSLRVTLAPGATTGERPERLLEIEANLGVPHFDYYADFGRRSERSRDALVSLLSDLRAQGARIVAFGAGGGMATTLLSYAGLDVTTIEYAVDSSPHKHGRYTPGSRLQIHPPSRLVDDQPDFILLLAWNYADDIIAAQDAYRRAGGRFIVPIPSPKVVS